jgi:hypothetical protein
MHFPPLHGRIVQQVHIYGGPRQRTTWWVTKGVLRSIPLMNSRHHTS